MTAVKWTDLDLEGLRNDRERGGPVKKRNSGLYPGHPGRPGERTVDRGI